MSTTRTAIISGGGIGGLTAALCLVKKGWAVQVLERAPVLEAVGAGLQLSPNAVRVLDALGLGEEIREVAFEPEALELRLGKSGQGIFRIPTGAAAHLRWGAPYLHIHRADLISVLSDALRTSARAETCLGTSVTGYVQTGNDPQLHLKASAPLTANLVIGADGLHSTIRTQMHGPDRPRFTGNLAWRAVVPMDRLENPPPPTACVWAGRGRHAVTYRLRGGKLVNFVGVVERQDWKGESWTEKGKCEEALEDFDNWAAPVTELISKADTHYRWALFDRPPLRRWHDGAVTLLGDACHPMLPFMAQGAAMAIEDAWVLAEKVTEADAVEAGIVRYEAIRKPRTSRLQAASLGNMSTFHRKTLLGQVATYAPMWLAGHILPGFVRSRQDWIYGYDVTAMDQ
ncbi:FAD-dependent monooxygenase [Henriciella sp.]|uniref:FAD-dependent monooxygenase n=1 Tax=Henriciella sp. TaxID=1968823 RepID=UPI00261549E1|nr:FAD-dependent monooxygenase [Henriciella sp.]